MGLDVYLYKCQNRTEADRIEREYETASDAMWEFEGRNGREYDQLTEAEKQQVRSNLESLRERMGMDAFGTHPSREKIEMDSAKYPTHLFKIGYFRSSYNEGGFDSVMGRIGLPNLYELFGTAPDSEDGAPDWESALKETDKALALYSAILGTPDGKYDVFAVGTTFSGMGAQNEAQALKVFKRNLEASAQSKTGWNEYTNRDGEFFLNGKQIFALIEGEQYGRPCIYAVYATDDREWYRQALEIVKETIEYVLAQPDKQDYYLSWSG